MWFYETCDEYMEFDTYEEAVAFCEEYDIDTKNIYKMEEE